NGGTDGIYTSVTGIAPNRIFVIEWRACIYNIGNCAGNVNFEVLLYEGQNRFDFVYGVVTDNGGPHSTGYPGATVGVQYGTGPQSTQFSCNTPSLSTDLRLIFTEPACPTLTPTNTITPTPTSTSTPTPPACGSGSSYVIATATATIIPGTTLVPGSQGDDNVVNIALPFTYNFYGSPYTSVNASTNGNLQFSSNNPEYNNTCLPAAMMSNLIAPHWDDLLTNLNGGTDGIYTSVTGSAPNRIFVIEWRACIFNGGFCGGNVNFEVLLYEGQNRFDFVYGTLSGFNGAGASVGVQRDTGSQYSQYECNTASLSTGLQLTFTEPACPTLTPTNTITPTPTFTSTPTPPTCGSGSRYVIATATATIIPGTTLVPGSQGDDNMVNITLPFTYTFYGVPYTSLNASTNGNLQFTSNNNEYANTCLPNGAMSNLMAPHWDDLLTNLNGGTDGIYTSVTGSAPNRIFVIEWRACIFNGGFCGGNVNFEVLLYEGQNRFDFVYGAVTDNGGPHSTGDQGATIGVQNGTGPQSTQFSCDTASLSTGLQLIFTEPACSTLTPTNTPISTLTNTPISTPTNTPTTGQVLVGHVTWQGRPAQPNTLQQVPITLTLKSGTTEIDYPAQTTDASGYFTASLSGLPNGVYNWRVKGTKWLANSGTLTLSGGSVTQQELGLLRAGDCNNDNVVSAPDFPILKGSFGHTEGQPGYDARADFTGDNIVSAPDFTLLKANFGQSGAPPINP
ncbi:MAG: dockerin type I domain-containing protein, partial [Chloroflexia bacterium]